MRLGGDDDSRCKSNHYLLTDATLYGFERGVMDQSEVNCDYLLVIVVIML